MSDWQHPLHGTVVGLRGHGLLLTGPSGAGKSDLALRLIDRGAMLVADDRVEVRAQAGVLMARSPATIAGLLEVRGLGILRMAHADTAPVRLVLDLGGVPERLPSPAHKDIAGIMLPLLAFDAFGASAAIRAEWAMALCVANRLWCADAC